ncbi:MAG TPA: phosphotransferase, partial [Steroidobacteraceae bacterium]
GGLSNFAWQVSCDGAGENFVRFARAHGARLGADHANERRVLELTSRAGLSPGVVRCDPVARLLVTHWVDARHVGRPLRSAQVLTRVAHSLASLHALPAPHDLRSVHFAAQAAALEAAFEPGRTECQLAARAVEVFAALRADGTSPALCHHDLNPLNLLTDASGRLWLVDWEYAGLGDTAFDLASFASQHGLQSRQRNVLVDAYRAAGGSAEPVRLERALWAFDYVQWLWYRAALAQPGAGLDTEVARVRADRLATSLRRRAKPGLALQ